MVQMCLSHSAVPDVLQHAVIKETQKSFQVGISGPLVRVSIDADLRPVVVAQLMDGNINLHNHVTTVTFTEDQANVNAIANVVKSALDLEMDIILTDGSGRRIVPSPGTSAEMEGPLLALCCRSFIGCRECIAVLLSWSESCLKCRTPISQDRTVAVAGLSEAIGTVRGHEL
ncbi:hypothetical protein ABVT39_026797 [Epinephelus coioides]